MGKCIGKIGIKPVSGFCVFLFLMASLALAQATGGVILGTVSDTTGGIIPGATITVKNLSTGIAYKIVTDELGGYRVPGLPPGDYEVTAELEGFKTEVVTGIKLAVGQQAVINVTLEVGELTEKITVIGAAPVIETTHGVISGLVDDKKIRDLPLNGRDFYQLTFLQAGVTQTYLAGSNPWSNSGIMKVSVNGMRPTMTNLLVDGTDANEPTYNIPPGGATGAALGVEAIREFRVLTNSYSAEFGRNAGAIVMTVTQSGSNEFHGSVFEFHRNDVFDAKNFFDAKDRPIPEFKRNQFGAAIGGPIVKDRTFFFFNYEGLRERFGPTATAVVPDADARKGLLPDPNDPSKKIFVGVDPKVKPFLDLFPLPNLRPSLGDGTGVWTGTGKRATEEDYFVVKIDHKFSEKDNFFVRYTFDDSSSDNPFVSTLAPGFPSLIERRNQWATIQYQRIIKPNLLHEFRFGFNRTLILSTPAREFPPELIISLIPGEKFLGFIRIFPLNAIGYFSGAPLGGPSNTFQYIDNISYTRGRHSVKAGVDIRRLQNNGFFGRGIGSFVFNNIRDFLEARPFSWSGSLDADKANSARSFRQTQFNLFVQDDYKISRNLTLNLGLRYELTLAPTEAQGRLANIRNPLTDTATTVGEPLMKLPKDGFQPRLGFAWTPFGNERTVIRGGFGLFHDQIWMNLYGNTRFLPPFFSSVIVLDPGFPNPLVGGARTVPPLPGGTAIQFEADLPTALQYNLQIQRQIDPDTVFKIGYIGTRGYHLVASGAINVRRFEVLPLDQVPYPAARYRFIRGAGRLNPNFGAVSLQNQWITSWYNSMQLSVERRFSKGLQFQAAYTWARSIDDLSGPFPSDFNNDPGGPQHLFDRKLDRGLSSFEVQHKMVVNYTWDLPFGPGRRFLSNYANGLLGRLLENWQLSGITSFYSGYPFTIRNGFNRSLSLGNHDRPLQIAPVRMPRTVDLWFDPSAFALQPEGTFGNVGRNSVIGPGLNNFDLTLVKNTKISEALSVQFRAEFFNLFNHPNFEAPNNTQDLVGTGGDGESVFTDPSGKPVGSAGKIFRTVTTSRQLQFGIKFIF